MLWWKEVCSHIYDNDTVLGCSRSVMSGLLRQPFFKIISHNENKNTFPPELSIYASEAEDMKDLSK